MPPPPRTVSVLLTAAALSAVAATAQQVEVRMPIGAVAQPARSAVDGEDAGVPVVMLEDANLDRYLIAAQASLGREDFGTAIKLLQDVIEGNTHEVEVTVGGDAAASPAPAPAPASPPPTPTPTNRTEPAAKTARPGAKPPEPPPLQIDPRNAVFSQDGRLYRPVRRLCHELLARMPAVGLEIYRANHEAAAEEMLQRALADGSTSALDQVANRYFVTLPAGRAMALQGDRLMHEGRYRAAVLVFNDLLEIYPATNRQRLGLSDVWCRFKIALCLRLAGEGDTAHAAVQSLAAAYPDDSLRVLGELYAVKDLPAGELFVRDEVRGPATAPVASADFLSPDGASALLPLWQFRFAKPEPYKEPKASNDRQQVFMDGHNAAAVMPFAGRYGPATWTTFAGTDEHGWPQALFFEHFRMRAVDATTGLLAAQSDATDDAPAARDQHPRVRIAASDFALLRPVDDGQRRYAVLGHPRSSSSSIDTLRASELVAYRRDSLQPLWSSSQWRDGEGGLLDVTFLAAPTVFGERLLLPALRRGRYSLECIDRQTGRPSWHTPLHGGGTPFFKAPGCPVVVQGGIAYVATNAGCVASVDAFTGDLRWVRRYERVDPLRKSRRAKRGRAEEMGMWGAFRQDELPGFAPSDMLWHDGLLIVAPCDSDMLLCLDAATGQPQWMLDATTSYARYGRLRGLVGLLGDDLFALSDTHLVAIGASGGLVKWAHELPAWNAARGGSGRGRGTIAGGHVLIPGEREILVFAPAGTMTGRLPLPAFDPSREPLGGSVMLAAHGPWLAVGYQGGVEMFSTAAALRQLASATSDARRKADLLVRAGDVDAAIEVLAGAVRAAGPTGARAAADDLLAIVRERAATLARPGDVGPALQLLDAYADLLSDPNVRLYWHLARVELAKGTSDLQAHEREQTRLYAFMEGKR